MDADGPAPKVLLADKGCDADFIREDMERRGGTAMIPTKRNRLIQLPVDTAIYALRNMVERCFNTLKNARRLATRYDKTADSYFGFITSSQSACGCANLSTPPSSFESQGKIVAIHMILTLQVGPLHTMSSFAFRQRRT